MQLRLLVVATWRKVWPLKVFSWSSNPIIIFSGHRQKTSELWITETSVYFFVKNNWECSENFPTTFNFHWKRLTEIYINQSWFLREALKAKKSQNCGLMGVFFLKARTGDSQHLAKKRVCNHSWRKPILSLEIHKFWCWVINFGG